MSDPVNPKKPRKEKPSWRSRRTESQLSTDEPNWRAADGNVPLEQGERHPIYRQRLVLLAVLLLGLGCLGGFIYHLLSIQVQTPLIAIVAGPYAAPFSPNAWAAEDLENLYSLHEKTLAIADLSSDWQAKETGLRELHLQLDRSIRQGRRAGVVLIYLSMHGVTDGEGHPCLVPPNASPYQSETWLPVDRLLDEIAARNLPEEMRIVLILDCCRMQTNWQVGLLYNGFTEGLEAVVRERITEDGPLKNLVVLNSTSAGEVGWASQDLAATVFGHYLRSGLAGDADDESSGGNGDREVSLHELRDYLQSRVDRWARFHRGNRQRPILLPTHAEDFPLTLALAEKNRTVSASSETKSPPVPEARIAQLWHDYARYLDKQPYHRAPIDWHEFQRQLLWLSAANQSGKQYHRAARQLETLLVRKIEQLDRQAGQAQIAWTAGDVENRAVTRSLANPIHSVPLARHLGGISEQTAEEISLAFARFQKTPNPDELNRLLDQLDSLPDLPTLAEAQLLKSLQRYGSVDVWNRPAFLQSAVRQRNLAEQLAAPQVAGIHYWTRPLIDAGDDQRRLGEDLLFVGGFDMTRLFQSAQERYELAQEATTIIQQALDVRDRTAAELPWLAQWCALPRTFDQTYEESELIEQLQTVMADHHQLSRMVDQIEIHESGNAAKNPIQEAVLKKQAELVRQGMAELHARFDKRYDDLLKSREADASTLRAIEDLLSVPLLPSDMDELGRSPSQQREALAQKRREIGSALYEEFFSGADLQAQEETDAPAGGPGTVTAELDRLVAHWKRHPALALLMEDSTDAIAMDDAGDQPRLTIARMGARLRRHLLTLPERTSAIRNAPAGTLTAYRKQLSDAARLARSAAWLGFPALEENPIVRLWLFDLQQLLAWHAQRTLDDFWGLPAGERTAFFERATQDYLENAGLVFAGNPLWDKQLRELTGLLAQRKQAANEGILTRATNSILIHPDEEIATDVVIAPGPGSSSLPRGYAAVLLQKNGTPLPTDRNALPLPFAKEREAPVSFPMVIPGSTVSLDSSADPLRATTLFRGHLFAEPFQLLAMAGTRVSTTPQSFDTARITLKSYLNRRSSIVFILDSSATMFDPIPRENTEGTVRKLDAARSALKRMLEEIAQLPRTHVGVFFYGHRVGTRPDAPGVLERQMAYRAKHPFDDSLQPYEDVEKVLELGRFNSVFAGQLSERMDLLKAWGETPLYLALTEAVKEFETDDPDAEKNIVVITDGLNYQFNPSTEADTSVSDVLAAVRGKGIHIHIVGLGITPEDAATAQREFGQIARTTDGKYVAVDQAARLIGSLKTVLEPREYTVTDEAGDTQNAKVRQPITVSPEPAGIGEYRVELGELQAVVPLEGGEAVELVVSSAEDRLESVRYEDNSPRFVPLIVGTPARASDYLLGIHQPKFFPEGVRFEVSIQDANRRVPPRPREIWMEVVPKANASSELLPGGLKSYPRYVYYDANFTPDRPVPVVTWTAENWPEEARFAEIRFWCNFRPTPPGEIIPWEDIINKPLERRVDRPLSIAQGITWQVSQRGHRIGIVERHSINSPGINALKVDLVSQVKPLRIVRRFDAEAGLVSHSFEFAPEDFDQFGTRGQPEIRFTTRTEIHSNAHRMDEAALIEIGEASDVIKPNTVLRVP